MLSSLQTIGEIVRDKDALTSHVVSHHILYTCTTDTVQSAACYAHHGMLYILYLLLSILKNGGGGGGGGGFSADCFDVG